MAAVFKSGREPFPGPCFSAGSWFGTSILQIWEKIIFYCSGHPQLMVFCYGNPSRLTVGERNFKHSRKEGKENRNGISVAHVIDGGPPCGLKSHCPGPLLESVN